RRTTGAGARVGGLPGTAASYIRPVRVRPALAYPIRLSKRRSRSVRPSIDISRLVHEQHGDAVADRVGEPALVADEFVGLRVVAERGLALRAGQDLQQPAVDLRAHGSRFLVSVC